MKKRVLLIGGACADLTLHVSEFAKTNGEVYEPFDYDFTPGGAISLGGVAVTRLGGEAILCGSVGDDAYGRDLMAFYRDFNMDTRFVRTVKNEKTPVCVRIDGKDGEEASRRTYRSSALAKTVTAELVEEAFTTLPDAVYVSLDIPAEAAVRAAELAREKKITAFFDGERMPEDFPLASLGVVDLIALGGKAAKRLTGIEPKDAQSNLAAAVELSKTLKAKTYIFKYGVGGAFAFKGNFSYYIPYVDGADSQYNEMLIPAMIVEDLRCQKSVRATRYASTVIARAASRGGAPIASIPTETEVLRYILEYEVEL